MAKKRNKSQVPQLWVVFDTNVLYTGSAGDLLKGEVAQLIEENSDHADLAITWWLPEVVVQERQYQMQEKGLGLLPSVQKLEKLLGHNLNITEAVVMNRVKEAIEKQLADYGIQPFSLVPEGVDWKRLMLDAVYRRPPFEPGEKEKGFRDALIAETFLQIIAASPHLPTDCRVILVTQDKNLADAVRNKTADRETVRVLNTLEELKGLINTLVAAISEDFVARIQDKAKSCFFQPREEESLYYREDIRIRIEGKGKFADRLSEVPPGADERENGKWVILPPHFTKKEGERVFWISRIRVEARAYKRVGLGLTGLYPVTISTDDAPLLWTSGVLGPSAGQIPIEFSQIQASSPLQPSPIVNQDLFVGLSSEPITYRPLSNRTLVASGESVFEVTWSVSVSADDWRSSAKVETIDFIETIWES